MINPTPEPSDWVDDPTIGRDEALQRFDALRAAPVDADRIRRNDPGLLVVTQSGAFRVDDDWLNRQPALPADQLQAAEFDFRSSRRSWWRRLTGWIRHRP